MEDRKRPARDDHLEHAPPLKRQATSINGTNKASSDADAPWKDDLERYQKEAILRQMQEYKRERNSLEARLTDMTKRTMYHDDHLRIIDAWWMQLLDEVKVLAGQIGVHASQQGNGVKFASSLLFSDNEKFEEHLRARSDQIRDAISNLFERLPSSSPDVADLQNQLTKLLAAEKAHITELERMRAEKEQLEERLENASLRYMVAEKKLDRAKSATVAKLERQAIFGGHSETGSGIGGPVEKPPIVKSEAAEDSNGTAVAQGRSAEKENALQEATAVSQKRKEQLEKLEAENEKLSEQLTNMTIKFSRLSDEDYSRTDLFKVLKAQHEDVIKRINHLEATNIQLREEAQKLQAERTEYKLRVETEIEAGLHDLKAQLVRAESDVTRIRNARDELVADLATRKAVQEQDQVAANQVKELAIARESRVTALESEIERLRHRLGESDSSLVDAETDFEALNMEDIRNKCRTLQVENAMLNKELPSMESAWKKASALASKKVAEFSALEERIARLAAEKSKADQKYFAAMKVKEARDIEVRTLRAQNSKSSEIISQLKEAESHARQLIINLEKQLAETRDALASVTGQFRTAQQQTKEKSIMIDGLNGQAEELKAALKGKDASLVAVSKSSRQVEQEAEQLRVRLEETKKNLEMWKSKGLGNQTGEYEMLRTIAICTVCRKNFKDTALQTCGHVFCKECVQERITSRSRKCPNCGRAFGANDHLHVTL